MNKGLFSGDHNSISKKENKMYEVYNDIFGSKEDIISQFAAPATALDGAEVIYAVYEYEDYSGSAFVLYSKDGKLYEVNGGHCSCNGLEDQWEPEETTLAAMLARPNVPQPAKERLQQIYG